MNYKIRLCLLTHNRPSYAKISLESLALTSISTNCEIYVSDNSSVPSFSKSILNDYARKYNINYKFREKILNAIDHFNLVIEESLNYDFILLFHDDDIIYSNYLNTILQLQIFNDDEYAAIAVNAHIINKNILSNRKITHYKKNITIKTPKELTDAYFCLDSNGAPPFSGYLYRISAIKNIRLNNKFGGKHSDFSFLFNLLKNGNLLWINEVLMSYRIHEKNDSNNFSITDRYSLLNFIYLQKNLSFNSKNDLSLLIHTEKYLNKHIKLMQYFSKLCYYIIVNMLNFRLFIIIFIRIKNRLIFN